MSPAQSEDSGLAADRGTTYATISIPRDQGASLGIILAGEYETSYSDSSTAVLEQSCGLRAPIS